MGTTPPRTSTLAVVSLIFGILGWLPVPVIGSVVAIVTGHLARAEIRRDPAVEGDGMAIAGLVLGYAALLVGAVLVALMLLFFGGLVWLGHLS